MIATTRNPYLDLGFHQTPPRIISEIKKPAPTWPRDNFRSRISGELLCWMPSENCWRAKRVSVRCGQLQIVGNESSKSESSLRFALRRLNLTPGPKKYSFALRRTQDSPPVLTLQASNQREFDIWVRTIAIELIRQTPLDAIKYLDILTLTPQLHSTPKGESFKDCNDNSITNSGVDAQYTFRPKSLDFDRIDENRNYYQTSTTNVAASVINKSSIDVYTSSSDHRQLHNPSITAEEPTVKKSQDDEHTVEVLLKKCQNADSYVPVKEKLKLFESLCRLRRIINNDDAVTTNAKRTRSLHDLSNSEYPAPANTGVKQICKYFETKKDETNENEGSKFNTIARVNRTNFGPVKTMISRKYSVKIKI